MATIVFGTEKGGSGKSTLVTCLAGALLGKYGGPIRIIDADPQRTTATWWERARDNPAFEGLEVVEHTGADLHLRRLNEGGHVLIDCPGRVDAVLRSALMAADLLLAPVQPSYPDTWALGRLAEQLSLIQPNRMKPLRAFVVINRLRRSTTLGQRVDELPASLPPGFKMLGAELRDLADFQTSLGCGTTPLQLDPRGRAAADVCGFVEAVAKLLVPRGRHG